MKSNNQELATLFLQKNALASQHWDFIHEYDCSLATFIISNHKKQNFQRREAADVHNLPRRHGSLMQWEAPLEALADYNHIACP